MKKFKVMIDKERYDEKPSNPKAITYRMETRSVTVDEFCELILQGYTFRPSIINGGKETGWIEQQVFVIDIDNGIKIEDALEKYNHFQPSIIYTTFSHTENKHKFRMVFITDDVITDFDIAKGFQLHLMDNIKECDASCKNLNRFYYGGNNIVLKKESKIVFKPSDINVDRKATSIHNINIFKDSGYLPMIKQSQCLELNIDDYYRYIKQYDMHELIGIHHNNPFKCVLPDHDDNNPSAGILISASGEYIYHCFGCGKSLNNIQLMERLLNKKNRYETLKWFENRLNIKKIDNEFVQEIKERIDINKEYFITGQVNDDYKIFPKYTNRYQTDLISLYEYSKINLYNEDKNMINGRYTFFAPVDKISKYVFNKSRGTTTKILALFSFLELIEKVDPEEFTEAIKKDVEKHTKCDNFPNYFYVNDISDSNLQNIEKKMVVLDSSNFTMKGFSREYLLRTFGEEDANKVFPQHKNIAISKKSDELTLKIAKVVDREINSKGYCTYLDIENALIKSKKLTKNMIDYQFKKSIDDLCMSYDWVRLNATKENLSIYGILDKKLSYQSKIIVKCID